MPLRWAARRYLGSWCRRLLNWVYTGQVPIASHGAPMQEKTRRCW